MSRLMPGVASGATFSSCNTYRYTLTRDWEDGQRVVWVMLNPSTADADQDDPTVRRCQTFARGWGFGGITVTNLFALRSTDPKALYGHVDPVGPDNNQVILAAATAPSTGLVMAAWGAHGALGNRGLLVLRELRRAGVVVHALGKTKAGHPKHPLYVPGVAAPAPMEER